MFTLSSIKIGMRYRDVRIEITKSTHLILKHLPACCNTDYELVKDLELKKEAYILRDYNTGIITDVTTDYSKINFRIKKRRET